MNLSILALASSICTIRESDRIRHSRHLGRFKCRNLTKAPAGEVLILVEFTVDVDGILIISATEMGTSKRPELHLVATAGLTRADVRRLSTEVADSIAAR